MPCVFELKVYPVILKDKIQEGINKHKTETFQDLNVMRQIGIVAQAFAYTGKAMIEDLRALGQELKNEAEYSVLAEFSLDRDNRFVFTNGAYKGNHLIDFDRRVKELTPNIFDAQIAATNRLAEEAFQSGSSIVAVPYYREGESNRDIIVMQLDRKTNKGKYFVINTAEDGNYHSFTEIKRIAQEKFTNLNTNSPTDRIFLLTDKAIPADRISKTIEEFKIKENGLEIKETQMRFDAVSGQVHAKELGREVDIEKIAHNHKLVRKIKSCHECAVETGKTEAFFYAPDNRGNEKKEREISQILVDQEGNVTFKTAILSSRMTDSDLKHLLLKLGYVGQKTPHEFSYTDDPVSEIEMKRIITEELTFLQNRNKYEFLSLRVFPIESRFDFIHAGFKTDRIIANSSALYFHDIAMSKGTKKADDKREKYKQFSVIHTHNIFASREFVVAKDRTKNVEEKVVKNFPGKSTKARNQNCVFGEIIKIKKRKQHRTMTIVRSNKSAREKEKLDLKTPVVQTMEKTYLEEEDVFDYPVGCAKGDPVLQIDDRRIKKEKKVEEIPPAENSERKESHVVNMSKVTIDNVTRVVDPVGFVSEEVQDESIRWEKREVEGIDEALQNITIQVNEVTQSEQCAGIVPAPIIADKTEEVRMVPAKNEDGICVQSALLSFVVPPKIFVDRNIGLKFNNLSEVEAQRIWEMFLKIYFAVGNRNRQVEPQVNHEHYQMLVAVQEITRKQNSNLLLQTTMFNTQLIGILLICVIYLLQEHFED